MFYTVKLKGGSCTRWCVPWLLVLTGIYFLCTHIPTQKHSVSVTIYLIVNVLNWRGTSSAKNDVHQCSIENQKGIHEVNAMWTLYSDNTLVVLNRSLLKTLMTFWHSTKKNLRVHGIFHPHSWFIIYPIIISLKIVVICTSNLSSKY